MPPICWHLSTTREAAERLTSRGLGRHLGSLLLGATAPDVRIMVGLRREETHFYDLEAAEQESGAQRIFRTYPGLACRNLRDDAQRALVAGYLTHLVTDEHWIETMYRPFFGNASPLAGDATANLLDRIVQFDMDRRERAQRARMEDIDRLLLGCQSESIGFLEAATLLRWRDAVRSIVNEVPSWEVLRHFAGRFFPPGQTDSIMAQVPQFLERALAYLTPARMAAFREEAITISAQTVEDYLT